MMVLGGTTAIIITISINSIMGTNYMQNEYNTILLENNIGEKFVSCDKKKKKIINKIFNCISTYFDEIHK